MSVNRILVAVVAVLGLAFLVGCGGSSTPPATAPPSGGFSNSNLKGTYVFSTSGSDPNGAFFAMAGMLTANGSGGITGGTLDINDSDTSVPTPIQAFGQAISGSSTYTVGVDGRGKINLVSTPLGTITFDFVLDSNAGGLITEFDKNGTGSGTLELQSATITQAQLAQGYAFSLSGFDANGNVAATAGAFTLGSDGTISTGVCDVNDSQVIVPGQPLTGSVTLGSGGNSGAAQLATTLGTLTFNFYVVDSTHLKFIETNALPAVPVLAGDVFQQAAMPTGTLVFTMAGEVAASGGAEPLAFGGFMTSSGAGQTTGGLEDVNIGGTVPSTQVPFTLNYTAPTGGRSTLALTNFSGGPSSLAVYATSGGVLMLEIDANALATGTAYAQSAMSLSTPPQGYGFNLSGVNFATGSGFELDDIAEFQTSSSTGPSGLLDENDQGAPANPQTISSAHSTLTADSPATGRGEGVFASSSSVGLFSIVFYTVDGSNTLFMETDSTQVAVGVFQLQSSTAKAAAAAAHPLVVRSTILPRGALRNARSSAVRSK